MISFITVQCPHCGVSGQILMPPAGSVIVGPCPRCGMPVVLFHGWVLPLQKEVMASADTEQIRQHVKEVLRRFIEERVDHLFDHVATKGPEGESPADDKAVPHERPPRGARQETGSASDANAVPHLRAFRFNVRAGNKREAGAITDQEFRHFVQEELERLDDSGYFRSIFG